ncbi:MAG: hypothetical protein IT452_17950 [Planctomycetia bacterium]|nr:hypothetical protein [Planctomycetia bacterium]
MKFAALFSVVIAASLLVAALVQAATLKRRLDAVPAPAAGAAAAAPAELPPSPYEMAELARRLEACSARLDAKIKDETTSLRESRERLAGLKGRSEESLAGVQRESLALKEELARNAADKEKVAELTKKIRTEQQKTMFKRFVGERMKGEMEKVKAELGLSPEQSAQFDKVGEEMFDKFAEVGSSFMDGEANPAKFQELVTETNTKMQTFMTEDQFKKYQDIQQRQFGGGRRQNGDGQGGQEGGGQ